MYQWCASDNMFIIEFVLGFVLGYEFLPQQMPWSPYFNVFFPCGLVDVKHVGTTSLGFGGGGATIGAFLHPLDLLH
jgi:hypothetical protein